MVFDEAMGIGRRLPLREVKDRATKSPALGLKDLRIQRLKNSRYQPGLKPRIDHPTTAGPLFSTGARGLSHIFRKIDSTN